MAAFHYLLLAISTAPFAALRFTARPRLSGTLMSATACLALADWILLLARDGRTDPTGLVWVTFFDSFIIIGIAWIPCYLLLRLPLPKFRVPAHVLGSLAAVVWILDHTPGHAITPPVRPDTAAITVDFCVIAFAALNWAFILRPGAAGTIKLPATGIAWVSRATAVVIAVACASLAWALLNGWR